MTHKEIADYCRQQRELNKAAPQIKHVTNLLITEEKAAAEIEHLKVRLAALELCKTNVALAVTRFENFGEIENTNFKNDIGYPKEEKLGYFKWEIPIVNWFRRQIDGGRNPEPWLGFAGLVLFFMLAVSLYGGCKHGEWCEFIITFLFLFYFIVRCKCWKEPISLKN